MADNEPMTDKRRYEIIAIHAMPNKDDSDEVLDALRDLLIENDRLRAEVAVQAEAMRIAADRDGLMHLLQEGREIVAQLSAENAAMRPVVEALAEVDVMYPAPTTPRGEPEYLCLWCPSSSHRMMDFQHTERCPVTQARAFLAAGQAAESEGE